MNKNKFIADKIQKLIKSGKSRNQSTAIAFAEFNSMQEGGDIAYNDKESKLKNIDKIENGVYNTSMGKGMYLYTSDGQREFVTDEAYKNTMQNTNQLRDYLRASGGINRAAPNTENKIYTPNNIDPKTIINSKMYPIDNIQSGVENSKMGKGYYLKYNNGMRDFVTEDAYNANKNNSSIRAYLNTTGGIDRAVKGTENKIYRPSMQMGGTLSTQELLDYKLNTIPQDSESTSNLKEIDRIQTGVSNDKLGSGYYVYSSDGQREFVTDDAYRTTMQNTPNLNRYLSKSGGLNRAVPGTENRNYRPFELPKKSMQNGGSYYENNNPYFMQNPGQMSPQNKQDNNFGADYMSMSNEQENLQPLTEDKKIMSKEEYDRIRLANLYGDVSPQMYGYGLGKAIDKKDGFGMAVNGLGLGLGTAKNILSGLGDSKMSDYTYNQYKENQLDDSSEYKAYQQGGYIPQLKKKKENTEVDNPNIDKTNAELLTGEYLVEDNTNPNVEIEHGEKVLHSDTGEVQTAEGGKHSQGGIKTELTEGSQVLSDYTKINGKNSKYFSDIFDIKSEARDTFAKTLDKIESKIGLKKLLKEEEELNLRIEKELQKQNPDKQTQDLNMQLLSEHSQEINKKKDELNGVRKIAFQELFEKQEEIPKRGNGEILKQEGGTQQPDAQVIIEQYAQSIQKDPRELIQMMQQMSPEKQSEALSQMYQALQQEAQNTQEEITEGQMSNSQEEQQEMQYAQEGIRVGSRFENADLYKKQTPTDKDWKTFGQLLKEKPTEALSEIKRLHPELYNQYFKDDKVPTYDKIRSFQEGLNSKYEGIKQDYIKTYGADSPQVKSVDEAISKDKFLPVRDEYDEKQDRILNKEIRGIDSFLGDWTSTRPNFAIDILPKKDLEDVNKAGVNTASQLRDKFPDLYKKYVEPKGLTSDFWLGKVADTPTDTTSPEQVTTESTAVKNIKGERTVVPSIPTYYGQAPTPPEPVYKGDIALGRLNPTKISIEPNLVEASRQMMGAQGSLEGLSPTQRAVAMQNMYTQNQSATNQAISQAQIANANSQMQVDQFNIGQAGKEDLTNLQNAMSYEQRNLGGKAKYEANLQRYFNNIAEVDKQNWRDVNNLNLLNARSDNFQTDGSNFYRTADDPTFNNGYGGASYTNMSLADKAAIDKKRAKDSEKAYQASIKKNA